MPLTNTLLPQTETPSLLPCCRAPRRRTKQPDAGAVPAASGPLLGMLFQRGTASPANPGAKTKTETLLKTAPSKAGLRTIFKVKYVAEGAAYLNGGRSSGLAEGMKLVVRDIIPASAGSPATAGPVVAELQVVSVAETSAVTEIHAPKRDVKPGDWAYLSTEDSKRLAEENALSSTSRTLPSGFVSKRHHEASREQYRFTVVVSRRKPVAGAFWL